MENQTRYDLNAAIESWRQELAVQASLTAEVRHELETHLRDAITGFQQRGLNDEESFWLARRRRVGQPPQLCEEFVKADPNQVWRERVFWMALASLIVSLWGSSLSLITNFGFIPLAATISIQTAIFFQNCLRLIFFWLPILACALMLAKGSLNFNQPKLLIFFRSRFQLAATATLWILANCSVLLCYRPQTMKQHLSANPVAWANFLSSLLNMTIWPFLLVALLVWLMPPQNQKTPKGA